MRRARVYNAVFDDTFSTLMNGCSADLQRRVNHESEGL
jgi:hypothetical protein